MEHLHLLIKPVSGMCNMRCSYCFYRDVSKHRGQADYGRMSRTTLRNIIKKAAQYAEKSCVVAFQGGEPTLAGLEFYRYLIELEAEYFPPDVEVTNSIQTNGYQLGEEWARFLGDHNFLVGVSLDGSMHMHNAYRKDNSGEGTFGRVMKWLDLLLRYEVDFSILTVVNNKVQLSAGKIYRYYKKHHFHHLQFIPCIDSFDGSSAEYSLNAEGYGRFLCELFDEWYQDMLAGEALNIRQFDDYLSLLVHQYAGSCGANGHCGIQHVIEADGSVYPCDFYVLDDYRLGNINETDLDTITWTGIQSGFIERSLELSHECRQCRYGPLCRGGCYRYRDNGGKHQLCDAYRTFFDHAADCLVMVSRKCLLNQWK